MLLPAYEVQGKVLFSHVSVNILRGGGTPSQVWGGGVSYPGLDGGEIPHPGGGYPSQVLMVGYPIQSQVPPRLGLDGGEGVPGVPPTIKTWWGTPPPWDGVPPRPGMGYPQPSRPDWGNPPTLGSGTSTPDRGTPHHQDLTRVPPTH